MSFISSCFNLLLQKANHFYVIHVYICVSLRLTYFFCSMFMVDIHNVSTKQNNINLIVLFLGRLGHLGDLLLLVFVLQKLQSQLLTCLMCSIFMVREIYIIIFMALPSPGHHTRGQICKRSHIVKKILYSNT